MHIKKIRYARFLSVCLFFLSVGLSGCGDEPCAEEDYPSCCPPGWEDCGWDPFGSVDPVDPNRARSIFFWNTTTENGQQILEGEGLAGDYEFLSNPVDKYDLVRVVRDGDMLLELSAGSRQGSWLESTTTPPEDSEADVYLSVDIGSRMCDGKCSVEFSASGTYSEGQLVTGSMHGVVDLPARMRPLMLLDWFGPVDGHFLERAELFDPLQEPIPGLEIWPLPYEVQEPYGYGLENISEFFNFWPWQIYLNSLPTTPWRAAHCSATYTYDAEGQRTEALYNVSSNQVFVRRDQRTANERVSEIFLVTPDPVDRTFIESLSSRFVTTFDAQGVPVAYRTQNEEGVTTKYTWTVSSDAPHEDAPLGTVRQKSWFSAPDEGKPPTFVLTLYIDAQNQLTGARRFAEGGGSYQIRVERIGDRLVLLRDEGIDDRVDYVEILQVNAENQPILSLALSGLERRGVEHYLETAEKAATGGQATGEPRPVSWSDPRYPGRFAALLSVYLCAATQNCTVEDLEAVSKSIYDTANAK